MNYTRRANRPDGNVYREMRRQTLRKARVKHRGGSSFTWSLIVFAILACGALAGWFFWK